MNKRSTLIVEDNASTREMFLLTCASWAAEIDTSSNETQALRLLSPKRDGIAPTERRKQGD